MPESLNVARFRAARTDPALAVLEGFHAIKHAIRFGATFEAIAARDLTELRGYAARLAPDVESQLLASAVPVANELFEALSPSPPETGVIAIARRRIATDADIAALPARAPIVLLEAPSHSGNIGAAIRASAGAGAAAVITTGGNDPWNPGAIRGSAGLHYALPVMRAALFDVPGRILIAVHPDGDDLAAGTIPDNATLAFGSERSGISAALLEQSARRIRIPMEDGVSSLNLATSVAIVLYTWRLAR